jgi:hypothetical protein
VQRLSLASRLSGSSIGEQILRGEWLGVRGMGIESVHQRRAFQDDPNSCVAMAVDPPFMTLGQAKPPLQIEIVSDRLELVHDHEKAGEKARHHLGHLLMNGVLCTLQSIDQLLEPLLPIGAGLLGRFEGCGDLFDVLDVGSDRLLFGPHLLQSSVDAAGQSPELLLGEPPFFSPKFRWIDVRISSKASAIRKPGG